MDVKKIRRLLVFTVNMLLLCALCFAVYAEGAGSGTETEAAPEKTAVTETDMNELVGHRLWGFLVAWCEGDTDRMIDLCSDVWKKARTNPKQNLLNILGSDKPYGFRIDEFRGKNGDPFISVSLILARHAEGSGYTWARYEIPFRMDADGLYAIEPDGFVMGMPAEAVPEEEMTLLTPEEIIRSSMGFHGKRELSDLMVPINLSVEKQGIRMEIVSAYAEGKSAWFVVSLEDPDRKYTGYELNPQFSDNIDGSFRRSWMNLYHDEAAGKNTYLVEQELDRRIQPENREVAVEIEHIRVNREDSIDLLTLLAEHGEIQEGIKPPKLDRRSRLDASDVPDNLKVLDYTRPLDIPLAENVVLTGIGWIDGQLHVQYHNKGRDVLDIRNGRASACSVSTDASVPGKTHMETYVEDGFLSWDEDNDGWPEWTEIIINCTPEEAGLMSLSAEISVTTEILEDDWSVKIPLNVFCTVADPEAKDTTGETTEESVTE